MWLYPNQSGFDHDLRGVKQLSDDKHGAAAGESDLKDYEKHLLYRLKRTDDGTHILCKSCCCVLK